MDKCHIPRGYAVMSASFVAAILIVPWLVGIVVMAFSRTAEHHRVTPAAIDDEHVADESGRTVLFRVATARCWICHP